VEIVDDSTVKFTSLIEANKNLDPVIAPPTGPRERRAEAPLSPDSLRKGERNWVRVLTICRRC
jgi:hypothetical protein